ncbi:hypothetical protein Tco_0031578 [Tanacetum coccineum]
MLVKQRTIKSSLSSWFDEFVDEGVPENEPRISDEEADLQKEVEESLKEVHSARRLRKVKEKVSDEQVSLDLLTLQTPQKKRSPCGTNLVCKMRQAGLNPDDAATSQPPSSHIVLTGPDLEHMNLEPSDTSLQPNPEQMDEELLQGELEQHMADMVEANQALEERLDKQGSRLYKLENLNIPHQASKAVDQIVTDAVDWAIQAPFRDRFRDLPEADMKKILHHRMWESNSYQAHEDHKMLYEALEKSMACDHTDQLLTDLAEARRKKKKRHASPKTPPRSPPHQPPPPPPPAGSSGTPEASGTSGLTQLPSPSPPPSINLRDQSTGTDAPSSSKTAASADYLSAGRNTNL